MASESANPVEFFVPRQQIFLRYTFAVLVDLTVLSLFDQYWDWVYLDNFTIALLAAILLQVLLQLTIAIEHRVAGYFNAMDGIWPKIMRYLSAWAILFGSKLAILEAINWFFGDQVVFAGPVHGLVSFITVVIAIITAEQLIILIYRSLGQDSLID